MTQSQAFVSPSPRVENESLDTESSLEMLIGEPEYIIGPKNFKTSPNHAKLVSMISVL